MDDLNVGTLSRWWPFRKRVWLYWLEEDGSITKMAKLRENEDRFLKWQSEHTQNIFWAGHKAGRASAQ